MALPVYGAFVLFIIHPPNSHGCFRVSLFLSYLPFTWPTSPLNLQTLMCGLWSILFVFFGCFWMIFSGWNLTAFGLLAPVWSKYFLGWNSQSDGVVSLIGADALHHNHLPHKPVSFFINLKFKNDIQWGLFFYHNAERDQYSWCHMVRKLSNRKWCSQDERGVQWVI